MFRRIFCIAKSIASKNGWYDFNTIITIDDMLKLTVDQIFPRRIWRNFPDNEFEGRKIERFHRVPKYGDFDNMWEFLCQIGIIKTNTKAMLNMTTKSLSKPQPSTDPQQAEAPSAEKQAAATSPTDQVWK